MAGERATAKTNLRAVLGSLEEYVNDTVRTLLIQLNTELSQATPKDTTHAASNWIGGENQHTSPAGSRTAVTWMFFHMGVAEAKAYTIRKGKFYLTNMVHYIGALDQGYSPQAPPGFVGMTIRRVVDWLNARTG